MILQLSDFQIILVFAVLLGMAIFAFVMGVLVRESLWSVLRNPKKKRKRQAKVKKKDKRKLPQDPSCKVPDGYVGLLRKLKKDQPYPEACATCPNFVECIGLKKGS